MKTSINRLLTSAASLILTFHLISCSTNQTELKSPEKLALSLFDAFNRHDWNAMAMHYSDTAQFLDPSYGTDYVKKVRTEIVKKYTEFQQAFPDLHDRVVAVHVAGDAVTVEFVSTGTSPDGSTFSLPIVSILTIRDGKIVKDATYYDQR